MRHAYKRQNKWKTGQVVDRNGRDRTGGRQACKRQDRWKTGMQETGQVGDRPAKTGQVGDRPARDRTGVSTQGTSVSYLKF